MGKGQTLVILSPGFAADEADTTCLPAQQVFIRAVQKAYPVLNIIILAFQYPFVAHEYEWNNIQVISFGGRNKARLHRLLLWYKVWKRLKLLRREQNIAGLLSFWVTECALVGKRFGKRHNIPHYSWILGQDARPGNKYIKLAQPNGDEVIAMSDFLSNQLYKNYGVKPFMVIPNGIDISMYNVEPSERTIDILAAGSLITLKQYNIFIEVVKKLHEVLPNLKVVLCGEGPERKRLQEKIEALGLTQTISLTGKKPHKDVLALMQQSKIFLHTSNYEGFSTVCLEALYAGTHVISFFKPMENEIKHWHIVPDKEAMAAKALELLLSPATQYEPVLPYAMDDIAKRVIKLYGL